MVIKMNEIARNKDNDLLIDNFSDILQNFIINLLLYNLY